MNKPNLEADRLAEAVLSLLLGSKRGATTDALFDGLRLEEDHREVFLEAMAHLRRVGAVVTDSPDHWRETTGRGHLVGRLHVVDKGFGFVVSEGSSKDVYVASNRMSSAINGDTVVVQIVKRDGRRGGPEGRVLGVAERGMTRLVGAFTSVGDEGWVGPDDPAIKQMVTVAVPEGIPCPSGAKVVVELDPPEAGTGLSGQITQVLGELGDPGVDIESIVHTFSLSRAYSSEAIAHAAGIVSDIEPQEIASRTDLRDVPTFTIDPKTAADMDDALSLEWTDDGLARVGIHIADVTHYIKPGSPVDLEASERSTSVYLPGEVIHMLPESLPSDVCSLRPGVDRLTMSAIADLDGGGGVTSVRFVRSVINSGAKLSYEEAQEVIDGTNAEDSPASGFAESIGQLHALAQTLRQRRRKEGSIEFDLPEPVVIFGDDGQIEAVTHAEHLQSHELIEEFMLLANRLVAEKLTEEEIPTLYRVHEPPSPERISDLNSLIKALGQGVLLPKNITPKAVQELVDTYRGKPAESVVVTSVLRSMSKARYTPTNSGHFGLAAKTYSHFTSPIRRYPDMTTHRQLGFLIDGDGERYSSGILEEIGAHSSEKEKTAEAAEREAIKAKQLEFLESRLGDEMEGTVVGVKRFGCFVRLTESLAEGLVHINDLDKDFYSFDDIHLRLIGSRTRTVIALGDTMTVKIARVDRDARRLDLVPTELPKRRGNDRVQQPVSRNKRPSRDPKSGKHRGRKAGGGTSKKRSRSRRGTKR